MDRMSASRSPPPHARAGFTLVEMLMTMAVMTVLVGIALPSFKGFVQQQRTTTAMHLLSSHLAHARLSAIHQRSVVMICPSDGNGKCRSDGDWSGEWMAFTDRDGNRQPDTAADILRVERPSLDGAMRIVSGPARPSVRYLPDGRSAGSNLTVRICRNAELLGSVIVNNVGRVRSRRAETGEACG